MGLLKLYSADDQLVLEDGNTYTSSGQAQVASADKYLDALPMIGAPIAFNINVASVSSTLTEVYSVEIQSASNSTFTTDVQVDCETIIDKDTPDNTKFVGLFSPRNRYIRAYIIAAGLGLPSITFNQIWIGAAS